MNIPPPNERFQFSLRSLLVFTFGAAVWASLFNCHSLASVFTAWLLMFVFLFYFRDGWCMFIHSSGLIETFVLLAAGFSFNNEVLGIGLKISGIVSFLARNYFLLVNLLQPNPAKNDNALCTIGKCRHCGEKIRAERPTNPIEIDCPHCGVKLNIKPKLSSGTEIFLILIILGLLSLLGGFFLPAIH
jgi:DNA-directed RNA polymerase subunit RPC12/RpoP